MEAKGRALLSLMFKTNETVCVSPNKYGYHSVPLEEVFKETIKLVSPDSSRPIEEVSTNNLTLVALNPIKGFRTDENCTSYRNFLVEMDNFELKAQIDYIERIGLPYSASIFSGNKSIHFLISLDTDLPNESIYRLFSEWILNIAALADQQTKNPSRSIRIPGARRAEGLQRLIKIKGKVKLTDLAQFLNAHPEARPKVPEKKKPAQHADLINVRKWVRELLHIGLDPHRGRNNQWFAIAYEFALSGMSEDDTIDYLENYFQPERNFKRKEWLASIRSAFKIVDRS